MLTLDQLASDWLNPRSEEDFSLPAITNFRGVVQVAWDIAGVQNWTFVYLWISYESGVLI